MYHPNTKDAVDRVLDVNMRSSNENTTTTTTTTTTTAPVDATDLQALGEWEESFISESKQVAGPALRLSSTLSQKLNVGNGGESEGEKPRKKRSKEKKKTTKNVKAKAKKKTKKAESKSPTTSSSTHTSSVSPTSRVAPQEVSLPPTIEQGDDNNVAADASVVIRQGDIELGTKRSIDNDATAPVDVSYEYDDVVITNEQVGAMFHHRTPFSKGNKNSASSGVMKSSMASSTRDASVKEVVAEWAQSAAIDGMYLFERKQKSSTCRNSKSF